MNFKIQQKINVLENLSNCMIVISFNITSNSNEIFYINLYTFNRNYFLYIAHKKYKMFFFLIKDKRKKSIYQLK